MSRAVSLSNHFKMLPSRLRTFTGIIQSLLLCRGCRFKDMAAEIKGNALLDSKIKSVSRFLGENHISDESFFKFMAHFLPRRKLVISIDRTIWEFGKEIRNVLVLAASIDKIAIPLIFKLIPYKGASTAFAQIELLSQFAKYLGKEKIIAVTADREFDSAHFIKYMVQEGIDFAVRLKKNSRIVYHDGKLCRLERIRQPLSNFETRIYGVEMKIDHVFLPDSQLLSIASSLQTPQGLSLYRLRWDIESCFKGCKSSGFKMEGTNLTNHVRLRNYIKCIFIAFALTIKAGILAQQQKVIPIKRTLNCKAYSIFQYGLRTIKNAYSKAFNQYEKLLRSIITYEYHDLPDFFVR